MGEKLDETCKVVYRSSGLGVYAVVVRFCTMPLEKVAMIANSRAAARVSRAFFRTSNEASATTIAAPRPNYNRRDYNRRARERTASTRAGRWSARARTSWARRGASRSRTARSRRSRRSAARAAPERDHARWSWLCYGLPDDDTTMPTLQK